MSFISGTERVVYDLIEFDVTAKQLDLNGSQRVVELHSTSTHVPFQLHLKFGLDAATYNFEAETTFRGQNILDIKRFFEAMRLLRTAGELELFHLKQSKPFATLHVALTSISKDREIFERVTDDLLEVAKAFGVTLVAPDVISKADLETLAFLLEVSRTGQIVGGTVREVTATLVRRQDSADAVLRLAAGEFMIGLDNVQYPVQHLLGAEIFLGPWRLILERASLRSPDEVIKKYIALKPGESIPASFKSDGPVRQIFSHFYQKEHSAESSAAG